jgi:hypothetical protein
LASGRADNRVSLAPPIHLESTDFSESTQTQACDIMELVGVELSSRAHPTVETDTENRWLTEAGIETEQTRDGRPISQCDHEAAARRDRLGIAGLERESAMAPKTPTSEFDLFVSYAHLDDQGKNAGKVSALISAIKAEYARTIGAPLSVFFDTEAIRAMDDWEARILTG